MSRSDSLSHRHSGKSSGLSGQDISLLHTSWAGQGSKPSVLSILITQAYSYRFAAMADNLFYVSEGVEYHKLVCMNKLSQSKCLSDVHQITIFLFWGLSHIYIEKCATEPCYQIAFPTLNYWNWGLSSPADANTERQTCFDVVIKFYQMLWHCVCFFYSVCMCMLFYVCLFGPFFNVCLVHSLMCDWSILECVFSAFLNISLVHSWI